MIDFTVPSEIILNSEFKQMNADGLEIVRAGQVLEVTLNRPSANAIDTFTSRRMGKIFEEFRDDTDLRCAIITGSGKKFFSAGWDLKAAAKGEQMAINTEKSK